MFPCNCSAAYSLAIQCLSASSMPFLPVSPSIAEVFLTSLINITVFVFRTYPNPLWPHLPWVFIFKDAVSNSGHIYCSLVEEFDLSFLGDTINFLHPNHDTSKGKTKVTNHSTHIYPCNSHNSPPPQQRALVLFMLPMSIWRHRDMEWFAQGHTDGKWQSQNVYQIKPQSPHPCCSSLLW